MQTQSINPNGGHAPSTGASSDENADPQSKAATKKPAAAPAKPAPAASKKRKSDAAEGTEDMFPAALDEIDNEDPRLTAGEKDTCNAVRRKIRNWIESGAMKVGEFQKAIGVSSKAYGSFMNRTGTWDGDGCDTYWEAIKFFKKRELLGLPLKAPAAKKAKPTPAAAAKANDLLDVSGVTLPGEEKGTVPVYDTCEEIRKKVRALLARDGVTQAAFLREISKMYPDESKKVSAANLRYFMGKKGPLDGNVNATFYAAYVFFEKQRVKAGKPKSKFREEMEKVHGSKGVDLEHSPHGHVWLRAGETAYVDKYGKLQIGGFVGRR
jgi:hypothetical protein